MTNWRLTLSYNGSQFHGWQVQPGLCTVQGTLAEALERITGEQVLPQGAGRTDAGVHALGQVASFPLRASIPAHNLQRALNRILPPTLRVMAAGPAPGSFHARHSARRKWYEYRIFERRAPGADAETGATERICSPFLAPFVWDCRWPLRLDALQAAAQLFLGTQDFRAMAAAARPQLQQTASAPSPVKTLYSSEWLRAEGLLVYRVCGSGFLHHMVRNLVGTMVDVGRGSLPAAAIPAILASGDRSEAGPTAPASGLYLMEVDYRETAAGETDSQAARGAAYGVESLAGEAS